MSCILAIDDRPINLQFLTSLLRYGGHTTFQASDGEEALGIVRQLHPDLIITDIRMPKMDGYEFVRRLREESEFATTPVIFYTAVDHELTVSAAAKSYGVKDIITKPSEPEEILKKVNAALGKWGSHRSTKNEKRSELEALQATGLKLSALVELSMELSSEHDPQKLLSCFCSTARHIIGARKSMLGILSENGIDLKYFLINGLKDAHPIIPDHPPLPHSILETIVTGRKVVRINHAEANARLKPLSSDNSPIRSFLGAPIMTSTETYGWLALLEKGDDSDFSEEDQRMATTLAAQVAVAYENALFSKRLRRNAEALSIVREQPVGMNSQVLPEVRSSLAALHDFVNGLLHGPVDEISNEQRDYLEDILKTSKQFGVHD